MLTAVTDKQKENESRMSWMKKMERRFGKYAIRNLMMYVTILYAVGGIISLVSPGFLSYLTLDFGAVLRGEIWRLFTFIIYPPSSNLLFILLSLYVYYMMGTNLERCWGTFGFNLFFFLGILFHILAAAITYFVFGESFTVGTQYLNLSLFFAFVTEFSEVQFLLFFIIPIKAKWLGIIDAIYFAVTIIGGFAGWLNPMISLYLARMGIPAYPPYSMAALVSLLNYVLFYFIYRQGRRPSHAQRKVQRQFKAQLREAKRHQASLAGQARHRCAVCGRTELDDPTLEFRFCSKCEGDYEYCQDHLYTHEHVTKS